MALCHQLFGGGAVIFANLFGHFLPEEAFAIIALIIMAELFLFFFVGVSVLAVARLRAIQAAAKKYRNSR